MDQVNKHRKGGFTMKKMMTIGIMFLVLALAAAALAGPPDQIRGRMDNLQQRIDEGVKSGTLTGQEAKRVQNQLNSIRKGFDSAVQNGLSDREAKHFNQRLDTLSNSISRRSMTGKTPARPGRLTIGSAICRNGLTPAPAAVP
jgi:septal ring factor EnvC (AmiA/AmiB activator)